MGSGGKERGGKSGGKEEGRERERERERGTRSLVECSSVVPLHCTVAAVKSKQKGLLAVLWRMCSYCITHQLPYSNFVLIVRLLPSLVDPSEN